MRGVQPEPSYQYFSDLIASKDGLNLSDKLLLPARPDQNSWSMLTGWQCLSDYMKQPNELAAGRHHLDDQQA
jgi:hypothetical protein